MIYRKKQYLGNVEEKLSADIIYGEGKRTQTEINNNILDQFPTATITTTNGVASVNDSSNLPLKDIQVLGNATQEGTPTPSTPIDINVVTGDNTVVVTGKNFFDITKLDITNATISGNKLILSGTSSYHSTVAGNNLKDIAPQLKVGETYTLSFNTTYTTSNYIFLRGSQSNWNNGSSIVITQEMLDDRIAFYGVNGDTISNIQIEQGSTASDYVAYQGEQSVTLPLGDIELAGILSNKNRIYKNFETNKWYIEPNARKLSLKGNESITLTNGCFQYGASILVDALNYAKQFKMLSDRYIYNTTHSGITGVLQDGEFGINTGGILTVKDTRFSTTADYATYVASQYTNGTPITYLYNATPTTTEITDTALINALEQVLAMTTYKTTTNFSIEPTSPNATGDLQITYRKDLQTLTDQIATLEARVELLEQ